MQTSNLWRDVPIDSGEDDGVIHAIIEIPRYSRNKFEYDHDLGVFMLSRVLFSPIIYPGDYGFIPQTHYDDGDPLDILVLTSEPTFPGCVIPVMPIGLFSMLDKGEPDDKVLAVPVGDPHYRGVAEIDDIAPHYLDEIEHFFSVYKDLEGVRVEPMGWKPASAARERVEYAHKLYQLLPTD